MIIKKSIYNIFEEKLGRTLNGMDYEIINAWLDKFKEELIIEALNEAIKNGANSLRYIDKVLYEWQKKGIQNVQEIEEKNDYRNPFIEANIFNLDWLNEK